MILASYYSPQPNSLGNLTDEPDSPIESPVPQLFECPSIYDWIQNCLATNRLIPFMTLPEMVATRSPASSRNANDLSQWSRLTPRTLMLERFFSAMRSNWSPAQFVEALFAAGVDLFVLETLPEAVLAPFQEAIVQCQNEPPTSWSKELLAIVGREDVNTLLTPGQRLRHSKASILVRRKKLIGVSTLTWPGSVSRGKLRRPLDMPLHRRQ